MNGHANRGKKLSPEEIAQRTETRRVNNGGTYQVARGWKHSEETRARMTRANRRRDLTGERITFYGKTHTEVSRAKMSNPGESHPQWKGGTGTLPYGPEFTRKFKKMIRERDNQTCQRCEITRSEYGKTLEVHHIDHDKTNNDPDNLTTTCSSCNTWLWWHRDEPFIPMNRR